MNTNLARKTALIVKVLTALLFLILGIAAVKLSFDDLSGPRNMMAVLAVAVGLIGAASAVLVKKTVNDHMYKVVQMADKIAQGEIDIDTAGNEYSDCIECFGKIIRYITSRSEIAERIAAGDISFSVVPVSDKDKLGKAFTSILSRLNALPEESARIRAEAEEPLNFAVEYTAKMANGEDLEDLTYEFDGRYGELIENLRSIRGSLYIMLDEAVKLSEAAENGDFSYRPDLSRLNGGYAKVIGGMSSALDHIISPINMTASYLRAIGKGEIPEKITDAYKGDFNDIKDSINNCIDGLGGLVECRNILALTSINDYTQKVEGTYQGIYADMANDINILIGRINQIIGTTYNIAIGDYDGDLNYLHNLGALCENDTLIPVTIQLMENVNSLLAVTGRLTTAAIEGDLDVREDSSQFSGTWKDLVGGMNNILEEMAKPLKDVNNVMDRISIGDLNVSTEGTYKGAFAELARSTNEIAHRLNVIVTEISEMLGQIADGNLALEYMRKYMGDFVGISDSFNIILDSLNKVMGDINEASDQVSAGSRQVSDGSQALSQGSTEQASSIEELTSSITEIASQTKQNAIDANQANDLASSARDHAVRGNGHMKEMLNSMADISESSENISKIIKVIDDIAFQTNILALNAAVEAARAGQHGKGFAVVAEEVRNLAARSAEAAKNTTELIEGSISKVQRGTQIANETASALNEIVDGIEKAASLVGNIATASNEQASGIAMINRGIEQVSQVVQNNSATAEESAAASEELSSQAELLKEMVGKFRLRDSTELRLSERAVAALPDKTAFVSASPKTALNFGESDKY